MNQATPRPQTLLGRALGSDWDTMSPVLRGYILLSYLLGAVVLVACVLSPRLTITHELGVLLIVSALVGPRTIKMGYSPDTKIELVISHPLVFTALLLLGSPEAVLVSEMSLLASLFTTRRDMRMYRGLFNIASFAFTTWFAGQAYYLLGGSQADLTGNRSIVALLAALLVYYTLNTLSIAVAVALYNRAPFFKVWHENFLWSAPSHFAGGSIALGISFFIQKLGIVSLILALPFCVLIYYSYKLYMDRLFEERKHSEEITRINLDLEHKVHERTHALEDLNQQLKESNLQLQRVSHLKSEFLANMSHELRTPLNAIIGFSELLLDQTFGELNEAQADYVNDILSSGRHLLELINDILDLSKIEAGKMQLRVESFDVQQVVEEAMATLQVAASKKNIRLERELPSDLPLFCADRGKFKQILNNLLSNAIKFTPEGGRVSLSCHGQDDDLEVSVSDTGIGIKKEDQERIFEAFMQVDGSYSRKYQGTGLGLTLVKRFIELHGGHLSVESEPGRGSRFTFWLPNVEPAEEDPVPAASAPGADEDDTAVSTPPSSARGERILVVEDNPANMKLITGLLRAHGFEVLEARSAEEALGLARRSSVGLILMDIMLPGMDGLACTRELKKDPATAAIPTIALTALAMKGDEERAREAGCLGYIAKPINTADFARQVGEYLKRGEPVDSRG
jgi:signal transduction histidine kinase/CheY-like chemotaxis protein